MGNCIGPYRLYGEPIVRECIEAGCDYLDLSGEPEWIERMTLTYGEAAKAKGVLVVSAAAFDSIPADMGVLFTTQQFVKQAAFPSMVESFLTLNFPENNY